MPKVLINFNRFGWPLSAEDTETVFQIISSGDFSKQVQEQNFDPKKHTAKQIVDLLQIPHDQVTQFMVRRYAMLSTEDLYIPVTLAKPEKIEQRIIAPLVSAKRLACIGGTEFLASIAMSGLVGEMLAVMIWEFHTKERQGKNISEKILFKKGFDEVRQLQRVRILHAFGYIDSGMTGKFKKLALERNKVLHTFTDRLSKEELESTAVRCYSLAAIITKEIFKLKVVDGSALSIDPRVAAYLDQLS